MVLEVGLVAEVMDLEVWVGQGTWEGALEVQVVLAVAAVVLGGGVVKEAVQVALVEGWWKAMDQTPVHHATRF